MPIVLGPKVEVYVSTAGSLLYGFLINKTRFTTYGNELGQKQFTGEQGVFFGAESPKPNKAEKQLSGAAGTVSSFCSAGKENTLQKNGWKIKREGLIRGVSNSLLATAVIVPMPGNYNHAWMLTNDMKDEMAILGIAAATTDTKDLVWGSRPLPPRATRRVRGTNSRRSTFIQPKMSIITAATAAGYSVSKINYDLIPDDT